MRSKRFARKPPLPCDEFGAGDGVDPRLEWRKAPRKVHNRKALQLCGEVTRTLNGMLQGECGDEVLRDFLVESVVPAPDSTRLLVTLLPSPGARDIESTIVLNCLQQVHGKLRSAVAGAINRKKTPELLFRVVSHP